MQRLEALSFSRPNWRRGSAYTQVMAFEDIIYASDLIRWRKYKIRDITRVGLYPRRGPLVSIVRIENSKELTIHRCQQTNTAVPRPVFPLHWCQPSLPISNTGDFHPKYLSPLVIAP